MKNSIIIFSTAVLLCVITGFSTVNVAPVKKENKTMAIKVADTTETEVKTVKTEETKLTLYKQSALATYYADKFNGRKTCSGEKFHNTKYTAAHMKLPFGTMVRVTNENNGKFVDVKVNDRGPFSKKLEIDLTKKAYMEIASNKGSGSFKVKIEIIEKA
ncbi:septal ring lytic transglycosylase RlpA family protein [Flavobacterium zepuense]|uniref:Septal ring lytic transglycosylase RlpA family protein n=1 Tax=Flavobacterium zepuense TaxID=2593302 RepID=A0A552UWP8_9FLAO|nr:septal ring lytic transglycosylase RlpA family protein [Flavobacterium zepuense]TRW22654.1 septal ring lytic transglycosylase RlpA family protein [Flavobacterium zepuense]